MRSREQNNCPSVWASSDLQDIAGAGSRAAGQRSRTRPWQRRDFHQAWRRRTSAPLVYSRVSSHTAWCSTIVACSFTNPHLVVPLNSLRISWAHIQTHYTRYGPSLQKHYRNVAPLLARLGTFWYNHIDMCSQEGEKCIGNIILI